MVNRTLEGCKIVYIDLDSTLAYYYPGDFKEHGERHIGEPISSRIGLVNILMRQKKIVKVYTARLATAKDPEGVINAIQDWTERHIGTRLEVTGIKHQECDVFIDDRNVIAEPNGDRIFTLQDCLDLEERVKYLEEQLDGKA